MGDSYSFKLGVAAAATLVGLATPKFAGAAESPNFFEYLDRGHFAAEMVCKYWYGEDTPAPDEKRIGMKVCHVVLHPVGVLRGYEREWWKQHEPKVLRGVEQFIQDLGDSRETPTPCHLRVSGCWTVPDYHPPNYGLWKQDPATSWLYGKSDKPLLGVPDSNDVPAFGQRFVRDRTETGDALRDFLNKP